MLSVQHYARIVRDGLSEPVAEHLVIEEPLQIVINGQPFSITMRTPGNDICLVKGLLYTEGVVEPDGLDGPVEIIQKSGYTEASVQIPPVYLCQDLMEKRSLLATASCGICGQRSAADIEWNLPPLPQGPLLDARLVPNLEATVRDLQDAFRQTGGSHAATAFREDGSAIVQFEDVGRHNAVDKVIGHLLESKCLPQARLLHVSGRVSYEIVAKAYAARVPFLCAVSAPSSLAVAMADRVGLTLMAFCREDRFTVYTHPENLHLKEPVHEA